MTASGDSTDTARLVRELIAPLAGEHRPWVGTLEGAPALTEILLEQLALGLADPDAEIRWWCVRLLAEADGDPRRVDWLIRALGDESRDVRHLAAMHLHHEDAAIPALVAALGDPEENIRDMAADAIGGTAQGSTASFDAAVDPLIGLLRDPSLMVRQTAAYALQHVGEPRAADALALLLGDADPYARARAAIALAEVGDVRGRDALLAGIRERGIWTDECVEALGKIRDPVVVDALVELLADPDLGGAAAVALGELRDEGAAPGLVRAVDEGLPSRSSAAWALGTIGHLPSIGRLVQGLSDDDPGFRLSAAEALGLLRSADAVTPLAKLATDANRDVRRSALGALARIGGARAVDALVGALGDECSCIRARAAQELGRMPLHLSRSASRAYNALLHAMQDKDLDVRRTAVLAIREMGLACPTKELLDAIQDPARGLCCVATLVLAELGSGTATALEVTSLLADPSSHVRWHAATCLGQIGETSSLPALLKASDDDPDESVRAAAALAVEKIRAPPEER